MIINTLLAQSIGCGGGFGPLANSLCNIGKGDTAKVGTKLNTALSSIIGFLTIVAALWFVIQFIMAGYNWINAGGDKNNAALAWTKITHAVIGLIIVVLAWVIVGVLGTLLGLDILNPGKGLSSLQIK